jgi:predicted RNA-binding protein with RPS1 domain
MIIFGLMTSFHCHRQWKLVIKARLNEGDVVKVKVLEIDKQGRVRLSIKEAIKDAAESVA